MIGPFCRCGHSALVHDSGGGCSVCPCRGWRTAAHHILVLVIVAALALAGCAAPKRLVLVCAPSVYQTDRGQALSVVVCREPVDAMHRIPELE